MSIAIIVGLVLLIGLVTVRLAVISMRKDVETGRGIEPGEGHVTITSEYASGLGGHSISYKVPRDPLEYAKQFIPKDKSK